MSGMPKVDTAVAATSVVGMADQIMRGLHDKHEHRPDDAQAHYVKAAIAGAIAIGAFAVLKKDKERARDNAHYASEFPERECDPSRSHSPPRSRSHSPDHHPRHKQHRGHTKDLMAETLGAYSLGRQMMGHTDHTVLKLVAEGLGLAALAREADNKVTH